jgi:branched-chain amino acid transport system substrate-binding protein
MIGTAVAEPGFRVMLPLVGRGTDLSPTPLKVAILADFSGPASWVGPPTRDGALLAIEEWNAHGGVAGREMRYITGDTQCDETEGRNAAQEVVEREGVKHIIGAVCSRASVAIAEYVNPRSVLQVSSASSAWPVTVDDQGSVRPFTFRALWENSYQGRLMGLFARGRLAAETAAVLASDILDPQIGPAFRDAFEGDGGQVVSLQSFASDVADYGTLLTPILAADPDVLFLPVTSEQVAPIATQARGMGISAVFLGVAEWELTSPAEDALEGAFFPYPFSAQDPGTQVQGFLSRYKARFGLEPDFIALLAYEAADLLLSSIDGAGTADPATVRDWLASQEHEVTTGRLVYDAMHNPIRSVAMLKVVSSDVVFDGSFRPD